MQFTDLFYYAVLSAKMSECFPSDLYAYAVLLEQAEFCIFDINQN